MNRNQLNKNLYENLKKIKVYSETNFVLIENALKELEVNYRYIEDNIKYLDNTFVFEYQKKVYAIRINAINYDYNKRRDSKGAGQHFHVVPTIPQIFELKNLTYKEVDINNLRFNSFFCHEDEYLKIYKKSDYIAPAGSKNTYQIYNNMPYLDCSTNLSSQINYYINCSSISSDNAFVKSKIVSENIFGRSGYLSNIKNDIYKEIKACKDELNGDRIYTGRFYSSYFKAIKKNGKIIYSPFSYNYKLFNDKNKCDNQ